MVVPTDFSETADKALAVAMDLARSLPARLSLIHVHAPVMMLPPPIDMVSLDTIFPKAMEKLEEALAARAARVRDAGIDCDTAVLEGAPHVEIVNQAEKENAELIVMGTHGRGGLASAILGSVTERVIHRATCPVLVVPDRKR
jgi:nucleotide-binding universal stress UspA family protein